MEVGHFLLTRCQISIQVHFLCRKFGITRVAKPPNPWKCAKWSWSQLQKKLKLKKIDFAACPSSAERDPSGAEPKAASKKILSPPQVGENSKIPLELGFGRATSISVNLIFSRKSKPSLKCGLFPNKLSSSLPHTGAVWGKPKHQSCANSTWSQTAAEGIFNSFLFLPPARFVSQEEEKSSGASCSVFPCFSQLLKTTPSCCLSQQLLNLCNCKKLPTRKSHFSPWRGQTKQTQGTLQEETAQMRK